MTKQAAIQKFKDWCSDKKNNTYREMCVQSQHQRNIWEANLDDCKIRISNTDYPEIAVWSVHEGIFKAKLTIEEFQELQICFIGNYRRNRSSL
jgi:hypothetical protein